jgi:hypothetical protein
MENISGWGYANATNMNATNMSDRNASGPQGSALYTDTSYNFNDPTQSNDGIPRTYEAMMYGLL